jgi:hypothetical protein
MKSKPDLSGAHLRAYEKIFQHPISHNLGWREVRALFAELGQVVEEPNGKITITRNGHSLVLHPSHTKDVSENDAIVQMRHFLERSEKSPPELGGDQNHFLLVINHHEARIFRSEMHGALPQRILPHEPDDYFRHAQDSKEFSRGQEKPDPNSFFEPVAKALKDAGKILIFGSGKGTSSEMDQFIAWLKIHHAELAERIAGAKVIDEHHMTEPQLLAKSREFYAAG